MTRAPHVFASSRGALPDASPSSPQAMLTAHGSGWKAERESPGLPHLMLLQMPREEGIEFLLEVEDVHL